MHLNGKIVDLVQLRAELNAAGISITALGITGDDLHTYDANGAAQDLPAGAATVVAAHVPPAPIDFGSDASSDRQAVVDAVASLRQYLGAASPNQAQTIAALKLLIRVVLFVLKRSLT